MDNFGDDVDNFGSVSIPFDCPYCGMSCPTSSRLDRHLEYRHREDAVIVLSLEDSDIAVWLDSERDRPRVGI